MKFVCTRQWLIRSTFNGHFKRKSDKKVICIPRLKQMGKKWLEASYKYLVQKKLCHEFSRFQCAVGSSHYWNTCLTWGLWLNTLEMVQTIQWLWSSEKHLTLSDQQFIKYQQHAKELYLHPKHDGDNIWDLYGVRCMCSVALFVSVQDTWSKMQADGFIKSKSTVFQQEQIKYLEQEKKLGKETRHIARQHEYKPARLQNTTGNRGVYVCVNEHLTWELVQVIKRDMAECQGRVSTGGSQSGAEEPVWCLWVPVTTALTFTVTLITFERNCENFSFTWWSTDYLSVNLLQR